jgi:hypothetical protein
VNHWSYNCYCVDYVALRDPEMLFRPVAEFISFMDIDARSFTWAALGWIVGHRSFSPGSKGGLYAHTREFIAIRFQLPPPLEFRLPQRSKPVRIFLVEEKVLAGLFPCFCG